MILVKFSSILISRRLFFRPSFCSSILLCMVSTVFIFLCSVCYFISDDFNSCVQSSLGFLFLEEFFDPENGCSFLWYYWHRVFSRIFPFNVFQTDDSLRFFLIKLRIWEIGYFCWYILKKITDKLMITIEYGICFVSITAVRLFLLIYK